MSVAYAPSGSSLIADGWVRVRPSDPCPVCRGKKWCLVHHGRGLVACTDPDHPSEVWWERLNAHVHSLDGRPVGPDWRDTIRPIRPEVPAPRPPLDPDELDRAYRALLAACPLSPDHRAAMVERGMSPEEVGAGGYGSLPADGRERGAVVARVTAALGHDPIGRVPGFYHRRDGSVGINALPGMLSAIRGFDGRINGVQVKVDDPDEAASGKYRWVSGGEGGVGIDGHTLHIARPPGPARRWRQVVVTEGKIKGEIVANRMRIPALCVAGVDNTDRVVDHLRLLDEGGGIEACIAFDADKGTNPSVARAEQRLVAKVRAAGYRVVEWRWSAADAKGIDDLLVQGVIPSPALYPDDLPLATPDPAPNAETQRMLREAREQRDAARREAQLVTRITAKKDLGGDVGNTVAVRLANYACWYAAAHGIQPGDPIPLVSKQIAKEFFDEETGRDHQAVSDTTVGKALRRFIDKGVIETVETTHAYRHDGVDKRVKVPGLVWSDRLALLERFADGSVVDEGEERNRGGKRDKRVPLVCPDCGQTHVACTGCGQVFDAVAPAGELAYLVNQDEPQPDEERPQGQDEGVPTGVMIVAQTGRGHPRLLGEGARGAEGRVDNAAPGTVPSGQVRRGWPPERGRSVDEGDATPRPSPLPGLDPPPTDRWTG